MKFFLSSGYGDQLDGTYNTQGVPVSQLRKLHLTDDDRALMNKVKTQGIFIIFY